MPKPNPQQFLGQQQCIPIGVANVTARIAPYDAQTFRPDLFNTYAITEPAKIQSATPKRRASFLAGRAITAAAFTAMERPAPNIPITANRTPQWPIGTTGSISHTNDYCATIIALRDDINVGIDIETILSDKTMPAVLKRVITDAEKATLGQINTPTATVVFSAKETIYKTLFPITQSFFGFDAAEICAPPTETTVQFALTQNLHETLPAGLRLTVNIHRLEHHILTWMVFNTP